MKLLQFMVDNLKELCILSIVISMSIDHILQSLTRTIRAAKKKTKIKKDK